ncbi:hypothetical protein PRDindigo_12 [Enterobacteria phage PRDindigo]
MTENIISWNVANWVTVILMALAGYAVLALAAKVINNRAQDPA